MRSIISIRHYLSFCLIFVGLSATRLADAITYTYPELYECTFPTDTAPCKENKTPRPYPLKKSESNTSYTGCYSKNLQRMTDIPSNGKCTSENAPMRVEVEYISSCPAGATIVACPSGSGVCCTKGAKIQVRPKIQGDSTDTATTKIQPDFADAGGRYSSISLGESGQSDPAKVACEYMSASGFGWDPTSRTCKFDSIAQCQALGLRWENDHCVDKCPSDYCSKKSCKGYIYQPDGKSCFCVGDSSTVDDAGRPCIDPTPTPSPTGSPAPDSPLCTATISFQSTLAGATNDLIVVFADHTERYAISNIGTQKVAVGCGTMDIKVGSHEKFPVRCVSCDGTEKSCEQNLDVTTSCGSVSLVSGQTYPVKVYPK